MNIAYIYGYSETKLPLRVRHFLCMWTNFPIHIAIVHSAISQHLWTAIQKKWIGILTSEIVPTRPAEAISMEYFWSANIQSRPSDFHLFPELEKLLGCPSSTACPSKLTRCFKTKSRYNSFNCPQHYIRAYNKTCA